MVSLSKDEFDIVCHLTVVEKGQANAGIVNQSGNKVGIETETDINTTNPAMQTETDIITTSAKKKGKAKVKQEGKTMRKRSS